MPKFDVKISKTVTYYHIETVDAVDSAEARRLALKRVKEKEDSLAPESSSLYVISATKTDKSVKDDLHS